jgi:hypothetical protein
LADVPSGLSLTPPQEEKETEIPAVLQSNNKLTPCPFSGYSDYQKSCAVNPRSVSVWTETVNSVSELKEQKLNFTDVFLKTASVNMYITI